MAEKKNQTGKIRVIGHNCIRLKVKSRPTSVMAHFSDPRPEPPMCGPRDQDDEVSVSVERHGPFWCRRYVVTVSWSVHNRIRDREVTYVIEF